MMTVVATAVQGFEERYTFYRNIFAVLWNRSSGFSGNCHHFILRIKDPTGIR